jgi:hypothetical protein
LAGWAKAGLFIGFSDIRGVRHGILKNFTDAEKRLDDPKMSCPANCDNPGIDGSIIQS